MKNHHNIYENCIILLMGFAGTGKRTIGEELSKQANFRFVHHHAWTDPILNLLGNNSEVWWDLNEQGWKKINEVRDVIFSTIANVSPKDFNFIITYELIDKDPYHKIFYDKVLEIVEKRNAHFLPVRLICEEEELVARVQAEDRKKYLKRQILSLFEKEYRNNKYFIRAIKMNLPWMFQKLHLQPQQN